MFHLWLQTNQQDKAVHLCMYNTGIFSKTSFQEQIVISFTVEAERSVASCVRPFMTVC